MENIFLEDEFLPVKVCVVIFYRAAGSSQEEFIFLAQCLINERCLV